MKMKPVNNYLLTNLIERETMHSGIYVAKSSNSKDVVSATVVSCSESLASNEAYSSLINKNVYFKKSDGVELRVQDGKKVVAIEGKGGTQQMLKKCKNQKFYPV